MKINCFILLFLSSSFIASAQEQVTNSLTDCPTFDKKNNSSKANMFLYMRTHMPKRSVKNQEQPLYTSNTAVPAIEKTETITEKYNPSIKKEKREKPYVQDPQFTKTESETIAAAPSVKQTKKEGNDRIEEETTTVSKVNDEENAEALKEQKIAEAKEKREKKLKKAALKSKMQHLFKKDKKISTRKNSQKCPTF